MTRFARGLLTGLGASICRCRSSDDRALRFTEIFGGFAADRGSHETPPAVLGAQPHPELTGRPPSVNLAGGSTCRVTQRAFHSATG
jgi:hypothetical protein